MRHDEKCSVLRVLSPQYSEFGANSPRGSQWPEGTHTNQSIVRDAHLAGREHFFRGRIHGEGKSSMTKEIRRKTNEIVAFTNLHFAAKKNVNSEPRSTISKIKDTPQIGSSTTGSTPAHPQQRFGNLSGP